MASDGGFSLLFGALTAHDIPFDNEELQHAWQSSTAAQDWVREQLTTATLLSKEELALYSNLEQAGVVDNLTAGSDLSCVRALSDEDISIAVQELKRSTAVIEQQNDVLRRQQDAVRLLLENSAQSQQSRDEAATRHEKRWRRELAQVNGSIEDASQSLRFQMGELDAQIAASDAALMQTADELLHADDKLLLSLQKLSGDLDGGNPKDEETMTRLRHSCARLIKFTVEGVRTRLDRVYLESFSGDSDDEETQMLQEELESLYSEILPVAQMSTEQQFLRPALRTTAIRSRRRQQRVLTALDYISECIGIIISRLGVFSTRVHEYRSHRLILELLRHRTQQETAVDAARPPLDAPKRDPHLQSHQRHRSRPSLGLEDELDPAQQLLRQLGLTPATLLEQTLEERQTRLAAHAKHLERTMESQALAYIHDAQVTLQLLQDSLLSETSSRTMQLVDQDAEVLICELERELQAVQDASVTMDVERLQEKSVQRARLISRWS